MKFEKTGLEDQTIELSYLDDIMKDVGLVRAGQWDYERVTYDKKIEIQDDVYYLRVQGYAVAGDVGARHAFIKLLPPLLGKHYYPHGVEYGEGETFPSSLVKQCEKTLKQAYEEIRVLTSQSESVTE
ncbi:YugN family protein [Priestia koreensis]|uniref:YugN family protein n=1 Tax=Priestia koreensis TaxID=284581 RepID=UPI001F58B6FA|nr:YugN family protein [Priestia koreensis]UNL86005.1 hypothetical protein IE339_05730 [Priestia koreensis]